MAPLFTEVGALLVIDISAESTTLAKKASASPPLQLPSVPHVFWVACAVTVKLVEVVPPAM